MQADGRPKTVGLLGLRRFLLPQHAKLSSPILYAEDAFARRDFLSDSGHSQPAFHGAESCPGARDVQPGVCAGD